MGQDAEAEQRRQAFEGYRIDEELLALADQGRSSCTICRRTTGGDRRGPPARPRSAAWDQAENRLHAQKALLALIVA